MDKQNKNNTRLLLTLGSLAIILLAGVGFVLYKDGSAEKTLIPQRNEEEKAIETQRANEDDFLDAPANPSTISQDEKTESSERISEESLKIESSNEQAPPSFYRAAEVTVQASSDFSADIRNIRVIKQKIDYLPGVEVLGPVVEFELDLSMHTFDESKGGIEFIISKESPVQTTSESGHLYLYAIRDGDYSFPLVLTITGYDRAVGKVTVSLIELYAIAEERGLGKNLTIISQPINFDNANW